MSYICIIGLPEVEKKEQEIRNLFEKIMKAKFPNLAKEIDIQVQEAERVTNKMEANRPTLRYIVIKMLKLKVKERIFKNILLIYF